MLSNYEKKIINLSLQGYSPREIADTLTYIDEPAINSLIRSLNTVNHPNYNPKLYNTILMEKSLKINNVIDKDLIFKVADMILNNYLPIEIAVLNNLTEHDLNQVIYNIKSSTYFDEKKVKRIKEKLHETASLKVNIKYQRILKLEKQYPNIKLEDFGFDLVNYRRWQLNFKMIEDFLENDLDCTTLAIKYNLAKSTVRNLLTNNDSSHFLENNFAKETCEQISNLYHARIDDEVKKIDIKPKETVDPKIESITKNGRFWILFILTFRISINDLAKMFKISDVKKLHDNLFLKAEDLNSIYHRALHYLDYSSSSANLEKAINFYKEYMIAKKTDIEKAKQMLKMIDEQDFMNLIKSHKRIDTMSEEEHRLIADNWVKFALSSRDFPYKLSSLNKYCLPYHEEEIKKIKDFNVETSRMNQRLVYQKNSRGYYGRR